MDPGVYACREGCVTAAGGERGGKEGGWQEEKREGEREEREWTKNGEKVKELMP